MKKNSNSTRAISAYRENEKLDQEVLKKMVKSAAQGNEQSIMEDINAASKIRTKRQEYLHGKIESYTTGEGIYINPEVLDVLKTSSLDETAIIG